MVEELGKDNFTDIVSINHRIPEVMASMLGLAIWEAPYSSKTECAARQGHEARYYLVPVRIKGFFSVLYSSYLNHISPLLNI